MSNKIKRNRQRGYYQAVINHIAAQTAPVITPATKRVTVVERRGNQFVVLGQMIGGLALGYFSSRAAAMRAAFKAGYTHVTGNGCDAREAAWTVRIRARYCVA